MYQIYNDTSKYSIVDLDLTIYCYNTIKSNGLPSCRVLDDAQGRDSFLDFATIDAAIII